MPTNSNLINLDVTSILPPAQTQLARSFTDLPVVLIDHEARNGLPSDGLAESMIGLVDLC
jgi:hypothetical protein